MYVNSKYVPPSVFIASTERREVPTEIMEQQVSIIVVCMYDQRGIGNCVGVAFGVRAGDALDVLLIYMFKVIIIIINTNINSYCY